MSKRVVQLSVLLLLITPLAGCSDDDANGTDADKVGIAAVCEVESDCPVVAIDGNDVQLSCLTQFSGGYCAIEACGSAADCPIGATCVAHPDGKNYCFRACVEKAECNENRPLDEEANCSASFDYADPADEVSGRKACIPPSSGT